LFEHGSLDRNRTVLNQIEPLAGSHEIKAVVDHIVRETHEGLIVDTFVPPNEIQDSKTLTISGLSGGH
jgi:hypothetical protein